MNNSNFHNNNSASIFDLDDSIYIHHDHLTNGLKPIRKHGMPPPPPRTASLYGLSSYYTLDRISESPHQYINKHINNNSNNNNNIITSHNLSKNSNNIIDHQHCNNYYSNYNNHFHQQQHQQQYRDQQSRREQQQQQQQLQQQQQQQRRRPLAPTRESKFRMSVITKEPNPIEQFEDEIGDNLSAVLREKMPNNDILYNEEKWLCGGYNPELYPEMLKVHQTPAYRLLDSNKKDNKFVERTNSKRKFRTRSESEPNEICGEGAWSKQQQHQEALPVIDGGGKCDLATKLVSVVDERRVIKLPATPKRQSPARVLLYNNTPSPRSPRHVFHSTSNGRRSSPVSRRRGSSLTRLHEYRRSRTKSPQLSRITTSDESAAEYEIYSRKSKSVDPTPTHGKSRSASSVAKPVSPEKFKIISPNKRRVDYRRSSCSSVEDDLDVSDGEKNAHDDSFESNTSSSSDSDEDGYRSHAYKNSTNGDKLTSPLCSTFKPVTNLSAQSSEESLVNPESLLVPSLFPNVPPYLAFSSNTEKGPEVPPELFKILKWKVTNVMPKLVRNVLSNTGVRLLKKTNDWMGTWGKHMKSPCFKTIRPYQKINHLPGSFKIGRKDSCWKNLQKQMIKYGKKEFGFMPKTYVIPADLNLLRKSWPKYAQRNVKWIIKPPASARGTGIRVVNRWAQIPKRKPLIVQRYIERPLLINGSKFDLRLYVLVTSINPLRVYMYHNGLARFASVKYSAKADTLNERCMHLTNYSINKLSSNYSKNEDVNACHGHKWTIKSLWAYLSNRGIRTDRLWDALRNLVMRTILAGEHSINTMIKLNVESKYSCFELFGFDVLLDAELVPWLLEVNISPSLHSELPLDAHVKAPLVQGVLNTALYNIPPKLSPEKQKEIASKLGVRSGPLCFDKRMYVNYLSRAERLKHNQYTRKSLEDRDDYINAILENLTPDDIRCLVVSEDELARSAPLERIFPTSNTHKYLKYTEVPRYYNRLLDAWETRYSKNRQEGIKLLQAYCEQKYHLEVPPSPARKSVDEGFIFYNNSEPKTQDSNVNADNSVDTGPDDCSKVNQTKE
ncbi:tubulin monoglutamylase TTLL4-like isoform X2 [Eupeodes corollae]|uniref:tubulin monoglutamylase TTLL4-like isoform X2 n=1 Tax=Eupeodes corollae TaxID=290404 RepID=UPI002491AEA2|nr:tubulin monoglutamylase TTLL4-like isoform X2 [Eupeodes corollae]